MAEGGTRVAAFVSGGAVETPGDIDHGYLTFMDVAPTILEIAGVTPPSGTFEGREVVPMLGRSFWGRALGASEPVYGPQDPVGAELHGDRTLVRGDWKILMEASAERWELFNLADDPGETNDLSAAEPALLAELVAAWEQFADDTGIVY